MAPVILTDLDDTLFQTMPKCPPSATDLRPMSTLMDGSPSGFATKLQQNFLLWLKAGLVIPVTARGRAVLARVNIPSSPAICSNGGCILDGYGEFDRVWHAQLEITARDAAPVADVYQALTRNLCKERFRHWSVEENGLDLYIVIKSNESDDLALAKIETDLAPDIPEGWRCHRNGNNLAYLPPWLSKRHAARYLIARYRVERPEQPIIGIGDSVSDVGFMDLCDFAAAPTTSQLWTHIVDGSKWID